MNTNTGTIRLLPIHMGGTIASVKKADGVAPGLDFETLLHEAVGEEEVNALSVHLTISPAMTPLGASGLDSSEIVLRHIQTVAGIIIDHYEEYDAFLITHGTDTLAYTAAFLSCMLTGLNKPVILTGSQRALFEVESDAGQNLADAFRAAGSGRPGVWVVFGGMVIAGDKATKVDTEADEGFAATDRSQLPVEQFVAFDIPVEVQEESFSVAADSGVEILYLSPNVTPKRLERMLDAMDDVTAMIVLVYGLGGHREAIWEVLGRWKETSGAVIVAKSQCPYGKTDLSKYAIGKKALAQGVLSAGEMGLELLYARLSCMSARNGHAFTGI